MSPHDVAREAGLLLANNPDREILAVAVGRMRRLRDGVRHSDGRWHVSPAARRAVGSTPPDLARQRFEHAHAVLALALNRLDGSPASKGGPSA